MVAVSSSFIRFFVVLNLGLAIAATYIPLAPRGTQFVTGPCKSDSDCAEGCCAFNTGKCAGPVFAQGAASGDGGCGFGDAQPNANAARKFGFKGNPPTPSKGSTKGKAGSKGSSKTKAKTKAGSKAGAKGGSKTSGASAAKGTQFVTGPCKSDADCAEGCCAFKTGKCAGPVFAQEAASGDGGCGFGEAKPNANAARKFGFKGNPPA